MNKSRLNLLVVEDDPTQGKALNEALRRAGYNVQLCTSSVSALTLAQRTEFHGLVVDCMLPKMNGVDLVEELLPMFPRRPKVFLLSGVFKDKQFVKEASERVQADGYFFKPLDLGVFLNHVEQSFLDMLGPEAPPVLRLYSGETLSGAELLNLIKLESSLHCFHLPKFFQLMARADLSGDLTLITDQGETNEISFYHGQIFLARTSDRESHFGSLAVSLGFVSPEDVLEALRDPSQKPVGQKLIESMRLSPHAIQVIMEEQLALRLSHAIQDGVVSLLWTVRKYPPPEYALTERRVMQLIDEWLESKITLVWVQNVLLNWATYEIDGAYHHRIHGMRTIEKVLRDERFKARRDLGPLFVSLMIGNATMGARGEALADFSFLESRLKKMAADFKVQSYFQILGVGEKSQQRELSAAYDGLKEAFDPDGQPENCPPELRDLCRKVFAMITSAYETLSDDVERLRYQQRLVNKRAEEMLTAEPVFRAAILELQSGHAREAAKKFQGLAERKLEFRDLRAYQLWAGVKLNRNYNDIRLDQIPPEERHSTAYLMAKGVYYRAKGQYQKALEAFRTAHVLDPRLSIARHELKSMVSEMEKTKANRQLRQEATALLENLFGRIRRGA